MTERSQVQRVLSGGRITISEEARKSLRVKVGDYVILRTRNGVLEVIPAKVEPRR